MPRLAVMTGWLAAVAVAAPAATPYPQVRPGIVLRFPADHGAHASFRTEWWYVTGWLKTADGKSRLLRVIAPLGVLLPNGLGLKIDLADIGRAGFVRCLPTGCVAEVIMDDKLLDQLKTGKTATFIIYQTPEEGVGIPLNLAGFGGGFDALP